MWRHAMTVVSDAQGDDDGGLIDQIEQEQASRKDHVGDALVKARDVGDPGVRMAVLDALPSAALRDPRWRRYLMDALADGDHMIRYTAAEAAGRLCFVDAIPALVGLLRDPSDMVRTDAVEALQRLCARTAAGDIAERLTSDTSRRVRGYAARAFAALRGKDAVPLLRECLAHERNRWASAWIALALYNLGEGDMLPVLLRKLRSKDRYVRHSLANGIERPANPSHCGRLLSALSRALQRETETGARKYWEDALRRVEHACARSRGALDPV